MTTSIFLGDGLSLLAVLTLAMLPAGIAWLKRRRDNAWSSNDAWSSDDA